MLDLKSDTCYLLPIERMSAAFYQPQWLHLLLVLNWKTFFLLWVFEEALWYLLLHYGKLWLQDKVLFRLLLLCLTARNAMKLYQQMVWLHKVHQLLLYEINYKCHLVICWRKKLIVNLFGWYVEFWIWIWTGYYHWHWWEWQLILNFGFKFACDIGKWLPKADGHWGICHVVML